MVTASKFQVWVKSALDNGTYWLYKATPNYWTAYRAWKALRDDYTVCELRCPTNHVILASEPERLNPDYGIDECKRLWPDAFGG